MKNFYIRELLRMRGEPQRLSSKLLVCTANKGGTLASFCLVPARIPSGDLGPTLPNLTGLAGRSAKSVLNRSVAPPHPQLLRFLTSVSGACGITSDWLGGLAEAGVLRVTAILIAGERLVVLVNQSSGPYRSLGTTMLPCVLLSTQNSHLI